MESSKTLCVVHPPTSDLVHANIILLKLNTIVQTTLCIKRMYYVAMKSRCRILCSCRGDAEKMKEQESETESDVKSEIESNVRSEVESDVESEIERKRQTDRRENTSPHFVPQPQYLIFH